VDGPDPGPAVVVVGNGGHALVCLDILRDGGHRVAGCVETDERGADVGVPLLGTADDLADLVSADTAVFVAVADNRARQVLTHEVTSLRAHVVAAISPHAVVSPTARIGAGALLLPGAVVNAHAVIGEGAIINVNAAVDHEVSIGAFAHVGPGSSLAGNVTVGDGALVGVGASVTPGRTIGAWSTVGAGSAVVRDVSPGATVAGVPAKTTYGSAARR
jgi:UDP-perosamine 4-acetyltransferase